MQIRVILHYEQRFYPFEKIKVAESAPSEIFTFKVELLTLIVSPENESVPSVIVSIFPFCDQVPTDKSSTQVVPE